MRLCECGCGQALRGIRSKRFKDDACRKRFARRRNGHGPDPDTLADRDADAEPGLPDTEPGRCRAGLEAWLGELGDRLPRALVAHARLLADEVDGEPDRSPMHGRYQTALAALAEAERETRNEIDDEGSLVLWKISNLCDDPETHAQARGGNGNVHCALCCHQRVRRCGRGEHEWTQVHVPDYCRECGARQDGLADGALLDGR